MKEKNTPVYFTTTLPYVNADPHVGFALEIVHADIMARHKKLVGHEVFFNTGTDEHGLKIYRKAQEEDKDPQAYVNEYAGKFRGLKDVLGLWDDVHFIRTTDGNHKKAAQEFWKRCRDKGDIEKRLYKVKYCVGCELEKTDSELEHDRCPIHPNLEIEVIEEENYFFLLSKYRTQLREMYERSPDFIIPHFRLEEAKRLVAEDGLEDFSISRLKSKMPWGIPVPDDPEQVMYVWFDALINYISTLGWPQDKKTFERFWGTLKHPNAVQFAGKDQVKQQGVMWQAMLLSAILPASKQIVIHGFITSGGQKMSKSLGNVIDPLAVVNAYGTDALRYYLARHVHPFEDSDFTMERFKEAYNAHLANGVGNLTARIMKMAEDTLEKAPDMLPDTIPQNIKNALEAFEIQKAADIVWEHVGELDRTIQETQPWRLVKEDKEKATVVIQKMVTDLYMIGCMLQPFLPATAEKIKEAIRANTMPKPLFMRK